MFISSYKTIYFFAKKFSFSKVFISVNTIFDCVYISTYANGGEIGGSDPKFVQLRTGGGGNTLHVGVHTYTSTLTYICFPVFGIIFFL